MLFINTFLDMISDTRQNPINNEVKKIIMWQIENVLLAEHLKYGSKKKKKPKQILKIPQ